MQIITDIPTLKGVIRSCRQTGQSIALVPTMGNLHQGHISLVNEAKQHCDIVIATIFVNPLQFGENEDLSSYPHTPEQDQKKLTQAGCDYLFMPAVETIYPNGLNTQTIVSVPSLSKFHCGNSRPTHFDGVATIVNKLFNLIPADKAFFGEKDFQQLLIIKKLVEDLSIDIDIIGVPTHREASGLAMSSRNSYLNEEEKKEAAKLYATLTHCRDMVMSAEHNYRTIEQQCKDKLNSALIRVDYFNICHEETLLPAEQGDTNLIILGSVYIGSARLIDNLSVTCPSK